MSSADLQVLPPLVACLVSAGSAVAIHLRNPRERSSQVAAWLVGGAAWWSFCQVLWTVAPEPEGAHLWHHLAAPGWTLIGPLALHLVAQHERSGRWTRWVLPPAYAVGAGFALLQLGTSWLHESPVRTPYGWYFPAGPGHPWFLAFTFGCVIPANFVIFRGIRRSASPARRRQLRLVALGIGFPFVVAGLTSGLLPLLGVPAPRLGSVSFGVLGLTIAWSDYRYGFSALAPDYFSREILATLPDGLALVGPDGRVLSGNERMAQLLGVPYLDLVDQPIADAFGASILAPPRELREHECRMRSRGGEEFTVSVSASRLRDKAGTIIGIVLVVRDLRELVALRSRLVTSGRLAAVGELAAGIAHEINNPIAFVRANLSQLQQGWQALAKRLPPQAVAGPDGLDLVAEGEELLAECIEGVERTVRIVHDVRGFAHAGSDEHEPLDLDEVIARVLRVVRPQVRFGVRVEAELAGVPPVLGTAPQLQQVFLNLVLNAVQAIDGEGCVRVRTRVEGGAVVATVSDDGRGIPPADRERIFDPFFTTKSAGVGTGLGLAISYQILEGHAADLLVDSEPGVGTTFTVRFPAA